MKHVINQTISLTALTCALVIGIGCSHYASTLVTITSLCALGTLALLIEKKYKFILFILFLSGFARLRFEKSAYQSIAHHVQGATIDAEGYVESRNEAEHPLYKTIFTLNITQTKNLPISPWKLQCYTNSTDIYVGDHLELKKVKTSKPKNASFTEYLIKEGVHATTFLKQKDYTLIHRPVFHIMRSLDQHKSRLLSCLKSKCTASTYTLITLMFFGNKFKVKSHYQSLKRLFDRWGIVHFLARSGLHLVVFIVFLQVLLNIIPISIRLKHTTLLFATSLYALLSWASISFSRAYITLFLYTVCRMLGLQNHRIHNTLLLIIFFLLCNPMLLFFLDFQLSFGLTAVLVIVSHFTRHQKRKAAL